MKPWPIILGTMKALALAAVIVASTMAAIYLPRIGTAPPSEGTAGSTPAEFITIILTAVTVILAALAIILALAGIVGYVQIKNAAEQAAEKAAEAKAEEVAARVAERMASKVAGRDVDAGDAFAQAEGGPDAGSG